MTFDPAKPVRTRDGRPARIVATDAKIDEYPIVALVLDEDGREHNEGYTAEGRYYGPSVYGSPKDHPTDLVNVPEIAERFAAVLSFDGEPSELGAEFASPSEAGDGFSERLGIAKITYENGLPVAIEMVETAAA